MKKTLALLLALCLLAAALFSCRNGNQGDVTDTKGNDGTAGPGEEPGIADAIASLAAKVDKLPENESTKLFKNPVLTLDTKGAWANYGFGDPYVMRYNGSYYLYMSTKDGQVGVKCYSSDDLVNWYYEGMCSTNEITKGAYAPEVVYYNGSFYMYTSPQGNGHYVLKSDSPTGPFEPATGNLGMSIDGSVFIDNDGAWYFYSANGKGINAYKMSSPTKMTLARCLTETSMNGWTEGPMVIFHDGYYYITYTGNHVLHRGYRINYASGTKKPTQFTAGDNPLIVCTDDDLHGIGHSSSVKGPDLDSYYIVYHSNIDGPRVTSIERLMLNEGKMEVLGPCIRSGEVPSMPDLYSHFRGESELSGWNSEGSVKVSKGLSVSSGGKLLSGMSFDGDFTAELTVTSVKSGRAGMLFCYTDGDNYGSALFDPESQKVIVTFVKGGEKTEKTVSMVRSFNEDVKFDCVQSMQVERKGDRFTFYMNDRLLCTVDSGLSGGSLGCTASGEAAFGYIGATAAVEGRGGADDYKSVSDKSGLIPANQYTTGKFETVKNSGVNTVYAAAGDVLNYKILTTASGDYDVVLRAFSGSGARLAIFVDGEYRTSVDIPAVNAVSSTYLGSVEIGNGKHMFSVGLESGDAGLYAFDVLRSTSVREFTMNYTSGDQKYVYTDGIWEVTGGQLKMTGSPATGKRLYGTNNKNDYTVQVSVTPSGVGLWSAGLLVRATDPGAPNYWYNECTADNAHDGNEWVQGYYIGITKSGVELIKLNYGSTLLDKTEGKYATGKTYVLRAECVGQNIRVYVDGKLVIDFTDTDRPFIQGMYGVRTFACKAAFDNFTALPPEGLEVKDAE